MQLHFFKFQPFCVVSIWLSVSVILRLTIEVYSSSVPQDPDIAGTQGFETLVKRLKEGSTVCKEIEDFLKNRFVTYVAEKC